MVLCGVEKLTNVVLRCYGEYFVSDKDIVQLIQREICRAAKDNHVRNVGSQMLGARAFAETVCSPYALAKWLDAEGLNDAIQIHFDTAVRRYRCSCTPVSTTRLTRNTKIHILVGTQWTRERTTAGRARCSQTRLLKP